MRVLKRLRAHQWAWIHFKLALGFGWASAMFLVTPVQIRDGQSDYSMLLWCGLTSVGATVSIVGMIISTSSKVKRSLRGLMVELCGLLLFASGPLAYLLIQITLLSSAFESRYALVWFAYSLLAAMLARAVYVGTLLFKGVAR